MENFTPVEALIGGVLIGLAALSMLFFNARIAGISGIFGGLLHAKRGDTLWRTIFVLGLIFGGFLLQRYLPSSLEFTVTRSTAIIVLAGFLVGFGARLGNGCTSGHGVCGIGRLAPRSIAASLTFMIAGIITATAFNQLVGGNI
ncbi:MAG: YeeE/YedE thiosulfate transporter family protein [Gammaproteobacteria bacterium]